jgi:hypothetical protein
MQIVYRARTPDDARSARDVLAAAGITAHIPDPAPADSTSSGHLDVVPVLVDNRCLGPARRALQEWIEKHGR